MIFYLLFGVILPIVMVPKIVTAEENGEVKTNFWLKILLLIGFSVGLMFITGIVFPLYRSGIPDTTSGLCMNTGGWTYSCPVDIPIGLVSLSILFLGVTFYNYGCKKIIYEMFREGYGTSKYVVLVLYLVFMLFLNVIFILEISGILISTHFDLWILGLFKLIVEFLPILIFPISVCKDFILKKI